MSSLQTLLKLLGTGFTHDQYYESMNMSLKRLNDEYTMLHYPLYAKETDSFIQAQKNLTDYCISLLLPIENKEILEIGCGNGVQSMYINSVYNPLRITGIDLNKGNIEIAKSEKERANINNVKFLIGDAQNLIQISSDSIDVLLNIESAFHYPDKSAFIREVTRVLKPGGQFLIADILSTRKKREGIMKIFGKPRDHNFWNRNRYEEEFLNSGLEIKHIEDISQQVRNGWNKYQNWLPKIERKMFFQNLIFRMFYVINVRLYIYLLRTRQQYIIFVGNKPLL